MRILLLLVFFPREKARIVDNMKRKCLKFLFEKKKFFSITSTAIIYKVMIKLTN